MAALPAAMMAGAIKNRLAGAEVAIVQDDRERAVCIHAQRGEQQYFGQVVAWPIKAEKIAQVGEY